MITVYNAMQPNDARCIVKTMESVPMVITAMARMMGMSAQNETNLRLWHSLCMLHPIKNNVVNKTVGMLAK
jgi:hypothetical protein